MNIDLTQVAVALIGQLATVITTVVYPLLKKKLNKATIENVEAWAMIAVKAAEQLYKGSGRGAEKKADVINFMKEHGISVDSEILEKAIEAAVLDLNNAKNEILIKDAE